MHNATPVHSETRLALNARAEGAVITGILGDLPEELIAFILSKLNSAQDLCSVGLACRGLYRLANDNQVWRSLCDTHFPFSQAGDGHRQEGEFLALYKSYSQLRHNVRTGACTTQTLSGLSGAISRLEMVGKHVYTDSEGDREIKIWDIGTRMCIYSLSTRVGPFHCFKIDHSRLYTVSGIKTIKIWDITDPTTVKCLRTLEDDENLLFNQPITDIQLAQNRLFTHQAAARTIGIWDAETGKVLRKFGGHPDRIQCFQVFDHCLYGGLADSTVKVWDIESGELLHMLKGHTGMLINALYADENCVYTSSSDNTVKCWDRKTGTCLQTLTGFVGRVSHIQVDGNRLYIGASDGTIRIYDATDPGKAIHLRTLEGHIGSIRTLQIVEQFVISNSYDTTVKIWDKATGECLRTLRDERSYPAFSKMIGSRLFTSADDGSINILDFSSPPARK